MQEQVAELEAKLAKLTAEFNAANKDKQDVSILRDHGIRLETLGTLWSRKDGVLYALKPREQRD